jgi:RNA polymerase sigma-70 factor (ECF subfamily)
MRYKVLPEASKRSPDISPDSVEFSELVPLHGRQVFQTCMSITRNLHDAEDAAQECFLRAFCHLDQFQGNAQISTWLNSIAGNCSLMPLSVPA